MLLPLMEVTLMIVILEEQRRSAACMRACVRWRDGDGDDDDGVMNVMQKSAKKYKKVVDNTILICYTYNIRYE